MVAAIRVAFFVVGIISFSFGISVAIHVQHLGIHPWDVLNVGLYEKFGFTIGTWNIICGFTLIVISWILDKSYIKLGTFLNAFMVGMFVDLFLWLDLLPQASHTWTDTFFMLSGIIIMGIGGGMYNAARLGSGPRDGFMLSMADKFGAPIGRVRIITESSILVLGLVLGGPVFIFTFIFTFIQSPIFQYTFLKIDRYIKQQDLKHTGSNAYNQRAK
ncbi:YczE/YyaS/YitT family protein [Virgibacillus ihumii]|uniref:YczE/YyaS/YitT family protein n=1 Tax=Virgibacillus ihumii TaxID=2686091 RepID=UPI00157E0206|nr:YitT family protein [Virgibacillus ihumii]